MVKRTLSRSDLWAYLIGSSVYATGGGAAIPSEERFNKIVDDLESRHPLPELIQSSEVADDSSVFKHIGAGGGIQADVRARYPIVPGGDPWYERFVRGFDQSDWIRKQVDLFSAKYPMSVWSEVPSPEWAGRGEEELATITGSAPVANVVGEIGPNGFYEFISTARKGIPLVDGDLAGGRAVPELSISIANIMQVNPCPVVFTTVWGDLIRVDKVLNFQRLEDITRYLAVSSGGSVGGVYRISGRDLKRSIANATVSKTIKLGHSILDGRKTGDPIQRILDSDSDAVLLFKGKVSLFARKLENAFHLGEIRLEGSEEYHGHDLRIWFKNENHISWFDGKPYVTSPDLISVVDAESGTGLSNAIEREWQYGRRVAVIGISANEAWMTERGLKLFSPHHFDFEIDHKPLKDRAIPF